MMMIPIIVITTLIIIALALLLLRPLFIFLIRRWRYSEHQHHHYRVPSLDNDSLQSNPLYRRVSTYLSSLPSLDDSDFANLFVSRSPNDLSLRPDPNQPILDSFLGASLSWSHHPSDDPPSFVLSLPKRDLRRRILRPYLHHIHSVSDEIDLKRRDLRLFTALDGRWRSVPFTHPSTIETVAMDPDLKTRVRSDLESFLKSRQYYHRLGRVWKRSYLFHGPSGTGKSSFVAAMARFLNYDVYDFDLARNGADLKSLLIGTTPRSLILVEDLDRYLTDHRFPELLNFMDGIVSCCGEERVMVFTVNSRDGIDPAMLRPGRVDSHVYFPMCDFTAFKSLASSYLGVKDHKLYPQVEEVFSAGASLSPAEVGEILIANRGSPSRAIKTVISAGRASARIGGGRRLSDGSVTAAAAAMEEAEEAMVCGEGPPALREIKKLYGFLKMRGGSRKEGLPDSGRVSDSCPLENTS